LIRTALTVVSVLLLGCSSYTAKGRFLSAEKHWNAGEYAAAVSEFEKVTQKDPQGILGIQALFRAASTQADFLGQFESAIKKFERVSENTIDLELARESQIQIAELLFNRIQDYRRTISYLDRILDVDPPRFLFWKARSAFFIQKFDLALSTLAELQKRFPKTSWAEEGEFLFAQTVFTRGGQFEQALSLFRAFESKYSGDERALESKFWIAASLEELDQLAAALQIYNSIENVYSAPDVVRIRIRRIQDRMNSKGRLR
jgi:tetratricopeptide (TPR) repeat protein